MKPIRPQIALLAAGLMTASASAQTTYSGSGADLPDDTPAGVSLSIVVTDAFDVTDLAVTLQWPDTATDTTVVHDGHTWMGDLRATLTHDDGNGNISAATLFNRVGKISPVSGYGDSADLTGAYTFADGGSNLWAAADTATWLPGSVAPGVYEASDNLFTLDAATSYQPVSLAGAFAGDAAAGTWTLNIADLSGGDVGRLAGWSLTLVPSPSTLGVMGLGGLAAMRRRRRT